MDPEIYTAWISAIIALVVSFISAIVALGGNLINYILSRRNQERELGALETRLRTEHKMELERIEKEQQLTLERFKGEQLEQFRMGYNQKQSEAYQKVWALLRPLSDYEEAGKQVIRRGDGQAFLNWPLVDQFFNDFRDFFYSEQGIFLSKDARTAIFTARTFIIKAHEKGEPQPDGWDKISNNQAKDIEQALDWVRKTIRRDAGLEDWHLPAEKLNDAKGE